jgi:hypothetical protein
MTPATDLESIRRQAILSSLAGFPFLLVFAVTWTVAGGLTYVAPPGLAPWLYPLLGVPATGIAIILERRLGYVPAPDPDPLLPLALQANFVQVVAFPALLLVWDQEPAFLPAAFAAVVGAHFLPFQWIYDTRVYGALGVIVATGPFLLVLLFAERSLHYTGFFVGAALLVGALRVRAHARATWRSAAGDRAAPHDPGVPA